VDNLINVTEMSRRLGVSVPMGYKLVALGRIPHISVEGAIRLDPQDVAEYVRQRRTVGTPPERRNPRKGRKSRKAE